MALDRDELNKRRKARLARRRRQQRMMILRLVIAVAVVAIGIVGLLLLTRDPGGAGENTRPTSGASEMAADPTEQTPPKATKPQKENKPSSPTTVIHVAAAGDLNVNDTTVSAGRIPGGYDYTNVFMDVAPVFAGADLAVLNFEGNLVGSPYGSDSVSAPQAMAEALSAAGVDMVQLANSCSVTHGVKGLSTTLGNVRAAGLEPLGAYATAEDFQKAKGYTIVEIQGIRIAFVAFTKGVGGLSLPAGSEDCVNLLYEDYATTYQKIDEAGITAILSNVATEKPDLTIAMVHWGSEYKDLVTKNQEKIARIMQDNGVDVILGTHSHMIHQIDYDPVSGQMIAYSLGDFFGEAERAGTDYSIILDLEITRDNASGDTRVTGYTYTPIYTLTEDTASDGQARVVRLRQEMTAYEENALGKVSQSVYEDMAYALDRIADRVTPEQPEEEE